MIAAGRQAGRQAGVRVNLTTKITLLLLLQLLGAATGLVVFASYLGQTEHDGHALNAAGRQRMLSVQIRAYAHMVSIGQEENRRGLAELVRTFDAALEALHRGGAVLEAWVPPAPEETRAEIAEVVAQWERLEPRLAVVARAPRSEARFTEASRYVEAHAEGLRVAADRFVHAYEARARRFRERMLRVLAGVVGLSVVLLLAGILLTRRYIVRPLRRLEEVARAVAAGDLSTRLDVTTGDELSALAHSFNEMSSRLQQTLADLNRQRRQAQKIVSSVPSGLMLLRGDMTVLEANGALCEMLCMPHDEVIGRAIAEVLPLPGLRERIEEVTARAEQVRGLVYDVERPDCPTRALRLAIVGTRHAEEEEEEEAPVLLVVDDLSEEERLRDQARASEESFRALIEQTPDAIAVHRHGLFIYVNPSMVRQLGHESPADLVGKPVSMIVHPQDREVVAERIRTMMATGELAPPHEERFLREDGSTVHGEVIAMPLVFAGEPAIVAVGRDITERKQLAARMMQLDRLIAVGTLAAGVGHEINNPLTYVVANLGFALEQIDELTREEGQRSETLETVCEVLREAQEGADRIRDTVRDLRTFSRAEEDAWGAIDIQKVLESSVNMSYHEIRHRARLVKDLSSTPPVEGNASRLGQVFLNLLVNAAHAIPEGAADTHQIRVRTSVVDGRVAVEVADTGAGISPEILPRIFDPFFTTKPVGQGTGLGLSICRKIMEDHGGELEVESEVGKGTTFRVLLPVARDDEPAVREAVRDAGREARGRILVVDDELAVTRILRRTLEGEHDVVALTSAREALDRLDAGESFDLFLCDLMMPEMTGMDLYDHLVQTMPEVAERMVFLTGGAFTPQTRQFLDRVESSCIDKPFSVRNLRALVRDLLRAGRRPPQ